MVTRAFDNDIVDGRTLKAFRRLKLKLRKGTNARKRIITTLRESSGSRAAIYVFGELFNIVEG